MNDILDALKSSGAYSHSVDTIKVIETHLSWIFLAGDFAYKLKKPIKLPFVDFSTLEQRGHFCREEVRLNRQFTDDLYIGVQPVVRRADGTVVIAEMPPSATETPGEASGDTLLDWVVKMHQFDQSQQADHLLQSNGLSNADFYEFGVSLAQQHQALAPASDPPRIDSAIRENFTTLAATRGIDAQKMQLDRLYQLTNVQLTKWRALLLQREINGFVRECHGDLHLANLVFRSGRLQAFDCLEFNRELREIDVWNDVAFLVMDCCTRQRNDLAYSFIDGYLNASGDYEGALLLSLFAQYRSLVRAKVAGIAYSQSDCEDGSAYQRMQLHLDWAESKANSKAGLLVVCCGLSGSGKSYWAAQLVSQLTALRVRSDVYRKALAGLESSANSGSGLGSGLYDTAHSDDVYAKMTQLCSHLLKQGESLIIDATCLKKSQRQGFLAAAKRIGVDAVVVHFTAPTRVLKDRIVKRQQRSQDASEADLTVLAWQQEHQETPDASEPVVVADTEVADVQELEKRIRSAAAKSVAG